MATLTLIWKQTVMDKGETVDKTNVNVYCSMSQKTLHL
jgi:hypothetical protein